MRLKSLWIDGFKNLNNFKIDFKKRDGITVLIGNNASGKSNILEAISEIFANIYRDTPKKVSFRFVLVYRITNMTFQENTPKEPYIRISKNPDVKYEFKNPEAQEAGWKKLAKLHHMAGIYRGIRDNMDVNDTDDSWFGPKDPFDYRPSRIIALYSGEELRLWEEYYQKFYVNFFNSIKKKQEKSSLEMLYLNKHVWNLSLITLFCSDNKAVKKFLEKNFDPALYDKGIDIIFTIDESKYKGYQDNNALKLVRRIKELSSENNSINTHTLKTLDIVGGQITTKQIFYYLYIASSPKNKGKLGVKIQKIITSIKIDQIDVRALSEGQKKQILLQLILNVLSSDNLLLLLDEPSAHIHIANEKLIPEMLKEYQDKREIILTTHSPTLAHSFASKHLAYVEDGKINEYYNQKSDVLHYISGGLMGISEQKILLESHKNLVLLVEGNTDKKHIETAFKKLKNDFQTLDFDVFSMACANNIKQFILGVKKSAILDREKTYIAIFDNDQEGKGCDKEVRAQIKNNSNFKSILLPVKGTIEDMYPKELLKKGLQKVISDKQAQELKLESKIVDELRQYLSDNCENFDTSDFKKFRELFQKIKNANSNHHQPNPKLG